MGDIDLFYKSVYKQTDKAFALNSEVEIRQIFVGDILIQCRFAGASLIPIIMPALEHLIVDEVTGIIEYTIDIWDSESNKVDFPAAPCGIDEILVRGEINGFISERYEAAYFTHARMLTVIDHASKHGVVCLANSTEIPAFELACPLRGILSWILRRNNATLIHAASVGTSDGCVIIGGNSGAGKSSTALRSLAGGMFYLGDDI
jgi:hypothetical protein